MKCGSDVFHWSLVIKITIASQLGIYIDIEIVSLPLESIDINHSLTD
jgi:hypothetical protein